MSQAAFERLGKRIVDCRRCPRLIDWCQQIAREKRRAYQDWNYWGGPVPTFGDPRAKLLIVGLAPAAHGANRTGRVFTGDESGNWLYRSLHRAGLANQPTATSRDDGLKLTGAHIVALAHCAPPQNKLTAEEKKNCKEYWTTAWGILKPRAVLCLGGESWREVLRWSKQQGMWSGTAPKFGHGVEFALDSGTTLLGCFHPSQQNTFTGRLTEAMLDKAIARARDCSQA